MLAWRSEDLASDGTRIAVSGSTANSVFMARGNNMAAEISPQKRAGRLLDFVAAAVILIFIAPLLLALCLVIWAQDGGLPIFHQRRVGLDGRYFSCFKLRTMVVNADARLAELFALDPQAMREWERDHKLRNDPRITPLGQFLRRSSLDELPQFFNVLRGDMSIVGPRPIVASEIFRYGRRFRTYTSVRPGITGLWQVSGRNAVTYRRRVALDVVYVRNKSLWLDTMILFATARTVVAQEGY
jgi:lipopolysaccharide/colanic/teichoic acid biosynthesis glycosyltransferase